jgi:hypothetical protein
MFELDIEIFIIFFSLVLIFYLTFFVNRVELFNDPMIKRLKTDLEQLDPRVKDITFYASNESFTEDKKRIYICLKDQNGNYYPYNMLVYVCLHELAHAFSPNIDMTHTSVEFITNFQNLIDKASKLNQVGSNEKLYDPNQPIIKGYCKTH